MAICDEKDESVRRSIADKRLLFVCTFLSCLFGAVIIAHANQPPQLEPDQAFKIPRASKKGTLVGTVQASDPDANDKLTYTITDGAEGAFTIDEATGKIKTTHEILFEFPREYGLSIEVKDRSGLKDTGVVRVSEQVWFETTPLCHYLDRGINDFEKDRSDRYVVLAPEISTLQELRHLEFGMDLPPDPCIESSHTIPCRDKDDETRWCITKLSMSVGGLQLFKDEVTGGETCLEFVNGGLGGRSTIGSRELRNNSEWGLSPDELDLLFEVIQINADGSVRFQPRIDIPGAGLEAIIEGAIGNATARSNKGNANGLYQGNKRGRLAFLSEGSDANCDGEACPSRSARKSSPWVEVRKTGENRIGIDIDLRLEQSTYDPTDCVVDQAMGWGRDCGSKLTSEFIGTPLATGSVTFEAALECKEYATIDVRVDPDMPEILEEARLPYCRSDNRSERCFRPNKLISGHPKGRVLCPEGSSGVSCGKEALLRLTTFDETIGLVGKPKLIGEGGALEPLVALGCHLLTGLFGQCGQLAEFLHDVGEKKALSSIGDELDFALLNQKDFKELKGCPNVSVSDRGDIAVDLRHLDACPPGAQNPDCDRNITIGGFSGSAPTSAPSSSPTAVGHSELIASETGNVRRTDMDQIVPIKTVFQYTGWGKRRALDTVSRFMARALRSKSQTTEKERAIIERARGLLNPINMGLSGTPATSKIPMNEISEGLYAMCATQRSCSSNFDIRSVSFTEVLSVDFDVITRDLSSLERDIAMCQENPCSQARHNEILGQIDAIEQQIGFVLNNPSFRNECVGHLFPHALVDAGNSISNRFNYLRATADWFQNHFEPEFEEEGARSCRATIGNIESHIRVPFIELNITTGQRSVTDNFAYVNFSPTTKVPKRYLEEYGCVNSKRFGVQLPALALCGNDGRIREGENAGEDCGTIVGEACADIDAPYYKSLSIFPAALGFPEDDRWHPNGSYSWHHRCFNDRDTGREMACIGERDKYGRTAPLCKFLGSPEDGIDPINFTAIGTKAKFGQDCPLGTRAGSDGRCWDEFEGRPGWECEADCQNLYGDFGWCYHGAPWRDMMEKQLPIPFQDFRRSDGFTYDKPICAEFISCGHSGVPCAAQGKACDPVSEQCVTECQTNQDCPLSEPVPRYPEGFLCAPPDNTCRTSFDARSF